MLDTLFHMERNMTSGKHPEWRPPRRSHSGRAHRTSQEGESVAGSLTSGERLLLQDWCAARAIDIDAASMERLGRFRELLMDWNTRMNLTSIRAPRDILIKHFLDSLAILPWIPEGAPVMDIGAGAGFPGMVVKLARLALPVTLIEATGKKVGFLEHVRREFRLKGCDILHRRLRGDESDLLGRFGVVVSRGVEPAGTFVHRAAGYLSQAGRIIAMSGRGTTSAGPEPVKTEKSSGCWLEGIERLDLPEGSGSRRLLLYRSGAPEVPRGT